MAQANNADKLTEKTAKAKRVSAAELKKRIAELEDSNAKLVQKVGEMTELYLNALSEHSKTALTERDAAKKAAKQIVASFVNMYGFTPADIF